MRCETTLRGPRPPNRRPSGGFSLVEVLAVVATLGILLAIVTPRAAKLIRRARDLSAISTLTRSLNQWRLLAIKRGFNVCVQFSTEPADATNPAYGNAIVMQAWEDRNPDFTRGTYIDPSNNTQNEIDLGCPSSVAQNQAHAAASYCKVTLESTLHLGTPAAISPQGVWDDVGTSVLFNGYSGATGTVNGLVVFTPTGAIFPPPSNLATGITPTGGRGIYFGDSARKNWFRVTIASDLSGKPREEMYIPSLGTPGYYPSTTSWVWQ